MDRQQRDEILRKVACGELSAADASKLLTMKREFVDFQGIYDSAHAAGMAAGNAHTPTPMIVQGYENQPVMGGVCGFAWISLGDARKPFPKWAMKMDIAHKGYPKGAKIWVHEFGQSMERKYAYALAFAGVLINAGIKASAGYRMD